MDGGFADGNLIDEQTQVGLAEFRVTAGQGVPHHLREALDAVRGDPAAGRPGGLRDQADVPIHRCLLLPQCLELGRQAGLHRISHGDVTSQFLRAGFALKQLVLIESEHDNRKFNVFQPTVRGRTDRFIAVFEKAAE